MDQDTLHYVLKDASAITRSERLSELRKTGLLDSDSEEVYDRLTNLACRMLNVPVALVSLVDQNRQFFKSACGLPEPVASTRQTPLSHSFCSLVVENSEPLVIRDVSHHPLVRDNPAVTELGVRSYVGFPIFSGVGHILGSFCVIDTKPREWSDDDIALVKDLAAVVNSEIAMRVSRNESRDNAERLELLLNSAAEGICGIDSEGNATFTNQECLDLLGYADSSMLLGKNIHDLIHHTHAAGTPYSDSECPICCALGEGTDSHVTGEVFWRADGTSFPVEYRSSAIVRDGVVTGAVVIFSDITKRIANEKRLAVALEEAEFEKRKAKRADREKSKFLANMSHEIRTPMNAVIGFTELLDSHVENPKAQRYLNVIRSSSSSLLNLINDILDLSKIEAAEVQLHHQSSDIRELAERVRLLLHPTAQEKGIELEVRVDEDVPQAVSIDPDRTRQVIVNLVGNALKFTHRGKVSLRISATEQSGDATHTTLVFIVVDTGIGIGEEDLKNIFKPFHQGAGAAQVSETGTGLGLSISQSIVRLYGGELTVESEQGKGSVFTAVLPDLLVEEIAHCNVQDALKFDFDDFEPADILIADDNKLNRELLAGYFEGSDHQINFASNGVDAVAIARHMKPTLILMDIRMPGMSGTEARDILAADSEHSEIPVIAVTASSMMGEERMLRKTFNGYIRKPIRPKDLYEELEKFLERRPGR